MMEIPPTPAKLLKNKVAITSVSLGQHASHTLYLKIKAAAESNFDGIEIVYADLEAYSNLYAMTLADGARHIKDLCAFYKITILSLNPFKNFGGHSSPLKDRMELGQHWISIAQALGAIHLQVPSQFDESSTGDMDVIIFDLRQLADLAALGEYPILIAYEAVSWGIHVSTWQDSLRIVERVNRPNFGLCLDAFHVISRIWGDNTIQGGKSPNGDGALRRSLDEFIKNCPMKHLFYVQLSDGELFDPPLGPGHDLYSNTLNSRLTWSRHARPFPLEIDLGGYFPVLEFVHASLINKSYTGWVSFEIFDRRMREERNGLGIAAKRDQKSWGSIDTALSKIVF